MRTALVVAFAVHAGCQPAPPASPSVGDAEALPAGPLVVVSAREWSPPEGRETIEEVSFRDANGLAHALRLGFTSYPIAPTSLTIDGRPVPQGPAWARLGRLLRSAGLSNNATILLLCYGGDPEQRC